MLMLLMASGSLHLGMRVAVASGVFNGALSGFTTVVFAAIVYVKTVGFASFKSSALGFVRVRRT